ncbi:hypothetical protein M758_10G147300 [Ceratodon purpureus]|nr:hypothetical protein M758_10G147300 [Ceratodon purpureus]
MVRRFLGAGRNWKKPCCSWRWHLENGRGGCNGVMVRSYDIIIGILGGAHFWNMFIRSFPSLYFSGRKAILGIRVLGGKFSLLFEFFNWVFCLVYFFYFFFFCKGRVLDFRHSATGGAICVSIYCRNVYLACVNFGWYGAFSKKCGWESHQ